MAVATPHHWVGSAYSRPHVTYLPSAALHAESMGRLAASGCPKAVVAFAWWGRWCSQESVVVMAFFSAIPRLSA